MYHFGYFTEVGSVVFGLVVRYRFGPNELENIDVYLHTNLRFIVVYCDWIPEG